MYKHHNILFILGFSFLFSACSSYSVSNNKIDRKHFYPWEQSLGYSQVVRAGNTLYISGITSDKATLQEQVNAIFQSVEDILSSYNLDIGAIVKTVVYTRDIEAFKQAGDVWKSQFRHEEYPASTWVQIQRLYDEKHLIEIDFVAYDPEL